MSSTVWQAFYFHGRDNAHPPARTELIEAATEDDAAKVATSHMGHCQRVDIAAPRWEAQQDRVILAQDDPCDLDATRKSPRSTFPCPCARRDHEPPV
jgi:hypothetical protein